MTTLICNCNQTMPIDGPALARALATDADGADAVHSLLCRREAGVFQRAAQASSDLLVACTQESRLFLELAGATEGALPVAERPIRFVNIRESGGWSKDAATALPKMAALIAAAQLAPPEPVATVSYASAGRVLVIGSADRAQRAAALLADRLDVSLLVPAAGGTLAQARTMPVHTGRPTRIAGWLGAFEVTWTRSNPIDADLCTRCNACIAVCPEQAIDFSYQIDLAKCTGHRDCVRACGAAAAIDFERAVEEESERFDLVLDLQDTPQVALHQPPQGYFHAVADADLFAAVLRLRESVGEFEKPKFFDYKQKICAHTRNGQIGCSACIDVCSAAAIRSDAQTKGRSGTGGIVVDPHLCVGCGACTTVCPSGALTYAAPRPHELGKRVRTMLATYARAGGRDAALLIHSQEAGAGVIETLGRAARTDAALHGLAGTSSAARGLAHGVGRHRPVAGGDRVRRGPGLGAGDARGGARVPRGDRCPDQGRAGDPRRPRLRRRALSHRRRRRGVAAAGSSTRIGPGDCDRAVAIGADRAGAAASRRGAAPPGRGDGSARRDLRRPARQADDARPRLRAPAARSADSCRRDRAAETGCGAEPVRRGRRRQDRPAPCAWRASARARKARSSITPTRRRLSFIEKNCVQCGLCASTCPEDAITLVPRLLLADGGKARRQTRVLNEAEPFRCIRCAKPFGTLRAIEAMVTKLSGHSMFQGRAAERLQMCGDCRVIDLHSDPGEVRITDL